MGMYLIQPGFTQRTCGPFTKNTERMQKFKEAGDSRCIYQNELDKAFFEYDIDYGDFKDLTRRTTSDKIQCYKALKIAKTSKYDRYQRGVGSIVYKYFDKKSTLLSDKSTSGGVVKNENISNQELDQ